jgi:four helix bundle protein
MATVKSFEGLEVWQHARKVVKDIYRVSAQGPFSKDFGLRDQLRRASISVLSNIAEGFERAGNKEFAHFLYMAKGSAGEVRSQLYVAFDLAYITEDEFRSLANSSETIARQLSGLIKYLQRPNAKT